MNKKQKEVLFMIYIPVTLISILVYPIIGFLLFAPLAIYEFKKIK